MARPRDLQADAPTAEQLERTDPAAWLTADEIAHVRRLCRSPFTETDRDELLQLCRSSRLRLLAPDGVVPPGPPATTRLTWALQALTLVRRREACRRWAQANNVHAHDAAQRFRLGRC